MADPLDAERHLFSSSPARPSHHRTQLPPRKDLPKRPLKRTASAAALLTPPGSPEKDKAKPRSAKRTFTDSEDEDDDEEDSEMTSPSAPPKRKLKARAKIATKERRAMERLGAVGRQESIVFPRGATRRKVKVTSNLEPVSDDVDRMCLDTDIGEPGSPEAPRTPRRGRSAAANAAMQSPPVPTTPLRRSPRTKRAMPVRDSPNNPFLSSSPKAPVAAEKLQELPTMTYVFRGVKAVFRNPAYTGPEPEDGPNGPLRLRPEHRDFSPDLMAAPKLLFPAGPLPGDSDDEAGPGPSTTRGKAPVTPPPTLHRPNKRRRMDGDAAFGGLSKKRTGALAH